MDQTPEPQAFLEFFSPESAIPRRILLAPMPFYIGRSSAAHWPIYSSKVSKNHAIIWRENGVFRIRDLDSRNGTFVNGKKIAEVPLLHGDILHIAHEEFRVSLRGSDHGRGEMAPKTDPVSSQLPCSIIKDGAYLDELLARDLVFSLFQPIVHLSEGQIIGYEALGRGRHSDLSQNPADLFRLAKKCGLERELSRVLRKAALNDLGQLPDDCLIFFNLHPAEMTDVTLLGQLELARKSFQPNQRLILEVHENAISNLETLHQLRQRLLDLDIGLAFDDFGVGQTRLLELAEIPPDFIKLDIKLIRGLQKDRVRQGIVESLCQMINERGVQLIAEGIESVEEAKASSRAGCTLGQGFFLGKPQPAVNWRDSPHEMGTIDNFVLPSLGA